MAVMIIIQYILNKQNDQIKTKAVFRIYYARKMVVLSMPRINSTAGFVWAVLLALYCGKNSFFASATDSTASIKASILLMHCHQTLLFPNYESDLGMSGTEPMTT